MKTKTLSEEAAEAIRGSTIEGNELRLPAQVDRKLYQEVNAVLGSIGGRWAKGRKAHVFPTDVPIEAKLSAIVDAGRAALPSKNGYFPTPAWLVDYMLGLADIEPHHTVLEPSAGQGAIADRLRELVDPDNLHLVELLPENVAALRAKRYVMVDQVDFLAMRPEPYYDRVVMNPPFEKQADIDHVLHAWAHLKPGGRLVSVMSAGVTFREDRKTRAFRDFLHEHDALVETNPEGAFKESGTGVSTVLVAIARPAAASAPAELHGQHEPIKAGVNGTVAPLDGVAVQSEHGGAVMPKGEAAAREAPPVDLELHDTLTPAADTSDQVTLVVPVAIDAITPSPENPRKTFDEDEIVGLAASIEAHGLMQPLVVRRKDDGYELIAGERRLRALRLLGRQTAPAIVQPDVDDRQALELALVENIQRVQLNPVEEARAIALMHDRVGLTAAQIAERLGKKVGYVERALAILALPDEVLAELNTGRLSPAQAGALATWSEHPKIVQLMAYHAITRKVSAATIEESALPFADQLYCDGLVTEVSHKAYRDEVCQLCPLQALVMERRDGYQDRFWCLRPTHAAELDVEFEHKKARDQESARVEARAAHLEVDPNERRAKAPDLSRLPYSTYETIGYRTMPPSCTAECPCRAVCRGSGEQLVEICLDTGRLRALKAGATRQKNRSAKTSKDGLLTDALIELDRMTAGDRRPLAILAQVVLERLGYDGRGVLDRALERYLPGVKLQPAYRWKTTTDDYDRLAELDPALLAQTLAGALVFSEVGQKESNLTVTRYLAGLRETLAGDAPEPEAGSSDGDEEDGGSVTDVADDGSEIEVDTSWYDDIRDELEPPDGE